MTDTIPYPVMEPQLFELKLASQTYNPQYNVTWDDSVDAWTTKFVDKYNDEDTIDYMFNSQEKLESILLELMEAQENEPN
tara:strand:- start:665 stop:904 length:240 start_codon:yes stop_codon:yes gene_type:complete